MQDRVEELRQKKMKLLLERSRIENTMMKKIKAKEELFAKLQELDEQRSDMGLVPQSGDTPLELDTLTDQ